MDASQYLNDLVWDSNLNKISLINIESTNGIIFLRRKIPAQKIKALFCKYLKVEARTGIEPMSTDLQSAA